MGSVEHGKELLAGDYEQGLSTTMAAQSTNKTKPNGSASSSAMKAASLPLVQFPGETEPATSMPASDDNGGWLPDWERDLMLKDQALVELEPAGSIASGGRKASSQGKGAQGGKFKKGYTDDQWREAWSLIAQISNQLCDSVLNTVPYHYELCITFPHPLFFLFNYVIASCFCFRNPFLLGPEKYYT